MAQNAALQPVEEVTLLETPSAPVVITKPTERSYQTYQILRFGFTVAPIVAGLDKFTNILVHWDQYLAPFIPRTLGLTGSGFMKIIGVIEIIAGIGVAMKPRIFAYVVSGWMLGIIANLLLTGNYFDVALRDLGLAIGAFALGRLSPDFDKSSIDYRS